MTNKKNNKYNIGNTVRVKNGVEDPDFGIDLSGWQGKITEIDNNIVRIAWDSVTLSNISDKLISQCEEEGLDWESMYLDIKEVEPAVPRDKEYEIIQKRQEIHSKHRWDLLGDSGKRIAEVLRDIDPDDEMKALETWEKHLKESLSFPFKAIISDYQSGGTLRQGDKIKVHKIWGSEDLYGVIVAVKFRLKKYHFPLCDISVLDKHSSNHRFVDDYKEWFSNR